MNTNGPGCNGLLSNMSVSIVLRHIRAIEIVGLLAQAAALFS
ncbi:MAG: hypothetical protein ACXWF8_09700 [Methylobacter sp.]